MIPPRFQRAGGLNRSERILAELADRSFLKLWTWPNLFMKQNSELTDLLVVFGDDVILFSDKGGAYPDKGPPELDWSRYFRHAIQESARQLNRAEGWLERFPAQVFLDARCRIPLPIVIPRRESRRIHRICVAPAAAEAAQARNGLPGLRLEPAVVGDARPFTIGRVEGVCGWVHVFDEFSLSNVMRELSTTPDLIDYLRAKEALMDRGGLASAPSESDLLAHYILNDRAFGAGAPLVVADGLWTGLQAHPQYQAREDRDRVSYYWDRLIDQLAGAYVDRNLEMGNDLEVHQFEPIIRMMAGENRFNRRLLSLAITDRIARNQSVGTILPSSDPDLHYVLLVARRDDAESYPEYRQRRPQELQLRLLAAKAARPDLRRLVGIGLDTAAERGGSEDLAFADTATWGDDLLAFGHEVRANMEYFLDDRMVFERQIEDEFPT